MDPGDKQLPMLKYAVLLKRFCDAASQRLTETAGAKYAKPCRVGPILGTIAGSFVVREGRESDAWATGSLRIYAQSYGLRRWCEFQRLAKYGMKMSSSVGYACVVPVNGR
jgi:hypothetical protein